MTLGLIGGTGLATLDGLEVVASHAVDTPYGATSMAIEEGVFAGQRVFYLHRHGAAGTPIPPHRVNYRANVWALRELGVEQLLAANAVGAINPQLGPGALVVPDQLVDYSWGREHSFDDGSSGNLQHIDFTEPYDPGLRARVIAAAGAAELPCVDGATLAVVQGPRLETAAEVRRLGRDGCDLVGMTGMPEAALARELALPYASLCMVVNTAAGLGEGDLSLELIRANLESEAALLRGLLTEFIRGGHVEPLHG